MKTLLKNLKGYVKESILGPLFKLFEAALELIVPLIIALIVDKGIPAGADGRGYVIKMCLVLVLLGAAGLAFSITAQYFAAKASVGAVTRLRSSLFKHLQTLSHTEIDTLGTSAMITRMTSDANQVQTGVNLTLRLLLRSPFVVFGAMVMAFIIDREAGASFIPVILILSLIIFGIMLISIPLYKKVQGRLDGVLLKTRESISGARVIRAFGKENDEIAEFEERNRRLVGVQRFVGRISALMNPLTYVIINLGILLLIEIGAVKVDAGNLTQGEVIALYNYMSQILIELIKLASLIITITKSAASASRIESVFAVKSSMENGSLTEGTGSEYIIELNSAGIRYKNSAENSLSNINLKIKKGESVGIIGGTGSGKSTLISLIARFYDATDGEVIIDGHNVREYDISALRKKIGVVLQKPVLFFGSIRENIQRAKKDATDEEIWQALEAAQARCVAEDKGGLDFIIEQGGRNLSGGQRQRLTIARTLVADPDILILDDSSSALDYATDAKLRSAVKEYGKEKTVITVSQRASTIMHSDKIIVLDDGEAVGIGTHGELLSSCGVYREIYFSQFKDGGDAE